MAGASHLPTSSTEDVIRRSYELHELEVGELEQLLRNNPGWYQAVVTLGEVIDVVELGKLAEQLKKDRMDKFGGAAVSMTNNIGFYDDELEGRIFKDPVIQAIPKGEDARDEARLALRLRRTLVLGQILIADQGIREPGESKDTDQPQADGETQIKVGR